MTYKLEWSNPPVGSHTLVASLLGLGKPLHESDPVTILVTNQAGGGTGTKPQLDPIQGPKTVKVGDRLEFTLTATDGQPGVLSYSMNPQPTGASLGTHTGKFAWSPLAPLSFENRTTGVCPKPTRLIRGIQRRETGFYVPRRGRPRSGRRAGATRPFRSPNPGTPGRTDLCGDHRDTTESRPQG
jgi:hypothetical protein